MRFNDTALAERWPALIGQAGNNNPIFARACFKTVRIG